MNKQIFLQELVKDLKEIFYNLDERIRDGNYNGKEGHYLNVNQKRNFTLQQEDKIKNFFPYKHYNFVAKFNDTSIFEVDPGERYYYPSISFFVEEV